jgi:hypothetical protein
MQELNMTEIEQVGGAAKIGFNILGVGASAELKNDGLALSGDFLGLFGVNLEIPLAL